MPLAKQDLALLAKALQSLALGVLMGTMLYGSLEVASAYLRNFQMERAVEKEAQLAASDLCPASTIRDELLRKSQSLGLPIEENNFEIQTTSHQSAANSLTSIADPDADPHSTGNVDVEVSYAVPARFPGYTLRLNFRLHTAAHSV